MISNMNDRERTTRHSLKGIKKKKKHPLFSFLLSEGFYARSDS